MKNTSYLQVGKNTVMKSELSLSKGVPDCQAEDIVSEARQVLRKWWGYEDFRPGQLDIIRKAMIGEDVLAILPTGGGKSICFQVPALMRRGTALVITPLIALMKDQVQHLQERGIKALCVNATMNRREIDIALNNALYGDFKFLYVSPERIASLAFRNFIRELQVSFIVVDEAHCISQWGYDFRPDYLQIGELRKHCDAPLVALTATATPSVAEDIMDKLAFRQKNLLKTGFERPNLSYIVRKCEDKFGQLANICLKTPGTGIVYVRSRRRTEELADFLKKQGVAASFYHAGLGHETRNERQELWKSGRIRVMVCTNAFGMGIDKPDVRFVVHFDVPDSPEAYFQEAGRGGRDGKRSYAVTLWNSGDVRRLRQIASVSFPPLDYMEEIYHKVHIFYEIPYDHGQGSRLKFQLDDFCRKYSLSRASTYYAIRYLERVGHWSFMEDLEIQTRVKITVDRDDLYDIDFHDEKSITLLDLLMRKYTGIFDFTVPIDETWLAESIGVGIPILRQMLYHLSLNRVIRYVPADRATVIFLHHDRLRPKNIDLKPDTYRFLKQSYVDRMEKMVAYVEEETVCRSNFLLEYFGQRDAADCGTCDICRARRRNRAGQQELAAQVKSYIIGMGEGWSLSDVVSRYGTANGPSAEELLQVVRELVDAREVPPGKE